jgi:cytochrome c-type biogenesis protein CcmH/NrfG
MKRSTFSILALLSVPLLLFAGYLLVQGDEGPTSSSGFVHPPIASSPADGMLRAQAGTGATTTAPGVTPSADNVSDGYYHEIFVLEERIKANPADTSALGKLGRLTQDGHDFEKAQKAYEAYLALRPEGRQVWIELTSVFAGMKDWDAAESTLNDMLTHFPGDETAQYNLGALAANAGRFEEAAARWRTLLQTVSNPDLEARTRASLRRLDQLG